MGQAGVKYPCSGSTLEKNGRNITNFTNITAIFFFIIIPVVHLIKFKGKTPSLLEHSSYSIILPIYHCMLLKQTA